MIKLVEELLGKLVYTLFFLRKAKEIRMSGYTNILLEVGKNGAFLSLESKHVVCEN